MIQKYRRPLSPLY